MSCPSTQRTSNQPITQSINHPHRSVAILVRVISDQFTKGSGLICDARAMASPRAASSGVVSAADEDVLDSCREAYVRAKRWRCSYSVDVREYIAELARAEMQVRTKGYLTRAARRVWLPHALDTVKKLNAKKAVLKRTLRTMRMDRAAGHKRRSTIVGCSLRRSSSFFSSTNGTRDCRLGAAR